MSESASNDNNKSLEQYLINSELLSSQEIDKVRELQQETGEGLPATIRRLAFVKSSLLSEKISQYYNVPIVRDEEWPDELYLHNKLSLDFLRENHVCPIADTPAGIILAMEDPGDDYAINAVRLALRTTIIPRVASAEEIIQIIERSRNEEQDAAVWDDQPSDVNNDDIQHLKDMALGTPVIRFVNQLLVDAVRMRATDIHIEPFEKKLKIRMRVDGMLHDVESPPYQMAKAVISRIKILSELNIAERRLPQDGRAKLRIENHKLDLRIATIPTVHGETIAIRILDNVRRVLDFSKLGFNTRNEEIVKKQLHAPYGMFIVTGPTGSGKTTTLATALSLLNEGHRKILTIEDPVEYELEGVNQTAVKPTIGLTFAAALRSILRHDPDTIMVGEMRDGETAEIGVNAALTGHLVLTTLHTNSAAGAIPRLLDMGIDAYLLSSSLRCVVGQRLVRRLCDECKEPYTGLHDLPVRDSHGSLTNSREPVQLWRAVGCDQCFNTGYSDRMVLSEVIEVNEQIQQMIKPGASSADIESVARQHAMTTMMDDGLKKCLEGTTTPEEVRRVVLDI